MFDLTEWRITYRKKGQQNCKVKHFSYMCDQASNARGFGGPLLLKYKTLHWNLIFPKVTPKFR